MVDMEPRYYGAQAADNKPLQSVLSAPGYVS
jgi:hypothetical protein